MVTGITLCLSVWAQVLLDLWSQVKLYGHCFLRTKAGTVIACLSHRNSICLSVRLTWVDQAKTVQARITKSSFSAAWKTLVSGPVKRFP